MTQPFYFIFVYALPVACIAWTVTKEEIFREPREYCIGRSKSCHSLWKRKFFYIFTCEYCFSHYVTIVMLIITNYTLIFEGWRGYLISGFSIVWIANVYMSLYNLIRIDLKKNKILAEKEEIIKEKERPFHELHKNH
ncbi:hypothetical protein SAMN04489864_11428 [Pedobacter insulae]|uniref:DUF1360 domain-containing protein n=1 Tax=Pedobacter insulae TaxID=414048 RepID=A0A1I3ADJ9_9SPHI|nr:hypothetical protein SAMN04489864_11428 [Pedobacter insulae]